MLRSDCLAAIAPLAVALCLPPGIAVQAAEPRCLVVDVFAASTDESADPVMARLNAFAAEKGGIVVVRRFVDTVPEDRAALAAAAAKHGGFPAAALPVVLACGAAVSAAQDPDVVIARVESACQVEVYTRRGCFRCGKAKDWLPDLVAAYPGLRPVVLDLTADAGARTALADLVRRHRTAAASVPVFHLCDRLVVGFDRPEAMRPRLERILEPWTRPCRQPVGEPDTGAADAVGVGGAARGAGVGRRDVGRVGSVDGERNVHGRRDLGEADVLDAEVDRDAGVSADDRDLAATGDERERGSEQREAGDWAHRRPPGAERTPRAARRSTGIAVGAHGGMRAAWERWRLRRAGTAPARSAAAGSGRRARGGGARGRAARRWLHDTAVRGGGGVPGD